MKKVVFKKGEVVFREGEMGNCFYQIEEGTAGVYVSYGTAEERKLTEMQAGQFFGEMAVIEAWSRSTTIIAESDLHTIEIQEKDLNAYFTEQPDKIYALMKQLGGRIREMTADYDEVKAFIEEKKVPAKQTRESFLAKLKKYLEVNALSSKNAGATREDVLKMENFGKTDQKSTQILNFDKKEIVFREGDIGIYMYVLHHGTVGIYTNYGTTQEVRLTTLCAPSFFGEMGMLEKEARRSATAVVEEPGTVLEVIREEDLEELFKSNPLEVDMILRHLSNRLRRLTADYMSVCRKAIETV